MLLSIGAVDANGDYGAFELNPTIVRRAVTELTFVIVFLGPNNEGYAANRPFLRFDLEKLWVCFTLFSL